MRTFKGIKASAGLAVGPVEFIDRGTAGLHRIVCDPFRERALYEAAIVLAKDELQRLQQHAQGLEADILIFQIAMLEDESFTNEIGDYIAAGAGSAAAVERAEQIFAGRLSNVDDDYIRERSVDVRDACRRVVDILDGRPRRRLHLERPSIIAANVFFPSDLFSLERDMLLGLVSECDSATSHASILARSMGIPALCQMGEGMVLAASGHRALLNADAGTLTVDPTARQIGVANRKIIALAKSARRPDPLANVPNVTRDGTPFTLLCSARATDPQTLAAGYAAGAQNFGVVRTEDIVLQAMSESQQYTTYVECLHIAGEACVTMRTAYASPEEDAAWEQDKRAAQRRHSMRRTQFAALMRAGTQGHLRVLLPNICDIEDWDAAMQEVTQCRQALQKRGLSYQENLPFGCLIDLPGIALMAGELIDHGAQFLAVNVDDLTRTTCGSPAHPGRVDAPAVLRLVQVVLGAAAARGVPVYLCGISEQDVELMPAYLRIGARDFCTERPYLTALKTALIETDLTL